MPAWVEIVLRLVAAGLGAYLTSQGHTEAGVATIGAAAIGDLPFRTTSTGASTGRAKVAEEVVDETVKQSAVKEAAKNKSP